MIISNVSNNFSLCNTTIESHIKIIFNKKSEFEKNMILLLIASKAATKLMQI